jgi:hypothetical protein
VITGNKKLHRNDEYDSNAETKCASRAQKMLGFAPYLRTWEGRKSQNWSGLLLSAHLACKLRTLLAKCASRAQAKCALKSAPDRLMRTTLAPDRTTDSWVSL